MLDFLLFVLASPILLVKALARGLKRYKFLHVAYSASLTCSNCQRKISTLGMWKCGCGFTYRGHVLRHCPICRSLPRMARCFACGNTELLPKP